MRNRSVPSDTLLPHLTYRSAAEAAAWLGKAFGFVEYYRYGDPNQPAGVMMRLGEAYIMLRTDRGDHGVSPAKIGHVTQTLSVFVADVTAHYEHAKGADVEITENLHETMYGELQYGAVDLDGHGWLFSQHARDVSPDEWGARLANG